MPLEGEERLPGGRSPQLGGAVVGGRHEVLAALRLFEDDVGDDVGVAGHRVLDVPLAQVPDLARVVEGAGDHVVAVGGPVGGNDALEVALQEHDALPGAQVPHPTERVHAARHGERAVVLEKRQVIDKLTLI